MGNSASVLQDLNDHKDIHETDDNHKITDTFEIGDYIKCINEDGTCFEGLYIERLRYDKIVLMLKNETCECLVSNCTVLTKAHDLEIGDKVKFHPPGPNSYLCYYGKISQIHDNDGIQTYDIDMEGDEAEDKEYGIPGTNIIKIMSRHELVIGLWKKSKNAFHAIHQMQGNYHHE